MSYYCKLCKICVNQGKPFFEDAHMYVYIYIVFSPRFLPSVEYFKETGMNHGQSCQSAFGSAVKHLKISSVKLPGAAVLFLEPWSFLGYPDITMETHDEHLQISSNLAVTPNNFGDPMDKSQANWPFRIAMVASPSLLLLFFIFILHFHRRHRHGHHQYCHYDLCYQLIIIFLVKTAIWGILTGAKRRVWMGCWGLLG